MDEGVKVFDGRFTDPFVELPFKTAKDITVALTTPAVTTDVDVSTSIVFTFSEDIAWSNTEEDRKIFFF